jgi:hypothetical protein
VVHMASSPHLLHFHLPPIWPSSWQRSQPSYALFPAGAPPRVSPGPSLSACGKKTFTAATKVLAVLVASITPKPTISGGPSNSSRTFILLSSHHSSRSSRRNLASRLRASGRGRSEQAATQRIAGEAVPAVASRRAWTGYESTGTGSQKRSGQC